MLHLLIEADWRSLARWGSLDAFLLPLAGDQGTPARWSTSYILRLTCSACGKRYLAASPLALPQACPTCEGELTKVATWDLRHQGQPPWYDLKES